jgi:RNA recognition motif-containing protein
MDSGMAQTQSMQPSHNYFGQNQNHIPMAPQQNRSPPNDNGEELIPTAIVIKNIPFAVKKEQLSQIMTDMGLPLPYAFNYHFDGGIFRGLAFANFTTPEETSLVIDAMNHLDLQGRKLRVEYKKMLPAQERERIERDKREKRGQLQEQHQPMGANELARNPLHAQSSMNSLASINNHPTSPSPVSLRGRAGGEGQTPGVPVWLLMSKEIDMNEPVTLGYYNDLLLFKNSTDKDILVFSASVPPQERRTIHTLAHHMGLEHKSEGQGDSRCVQIFKNKAALSPPIAQLPPQQYYNDSRRGLARAATIDFSEARGDPSYHSKHTLGRQDSGHLNIPGSPGLGGINHNLRAAKSFADLRSYTPSPVPSTASFPAGLSQNISRYTDYGQHSAASGTPNLTPTSAGGGMNGRDESFLANGLGSMTLTGYDRRTNPGGRIGQERDTHTPSAGPIGSQRPTNGNSYEENPRNGSTAVPERQPRGPGAEWGNGGFSSRPRQNGHVNRGSGELDLNSFENSWDDNRGQDSSDRNGAPRSQYNH